MGRGLYEGSAVFARVFDQVSGLLELELGVSVRDVVLGAQDADESLVNQTLYAQTGLFAFEVALAELLAASGLAADAVVGHSVGEVVAAYVAGVLSLPDACRLVAARARLMQGLPSGGAMAAVNVSEADVVASMAGVAGVSIAAVNGPDSVVVSGDADAVAQVVEYWRGQGRRVRELRVSHAFHSPAMDPVMGELGRVASELEYRRPQVLWAGALSGELVSECEPGYWPAQTRQAVRFADALGTLAAQGINLFIEVGPDGSLSALGADAGEEAVFVPLQRRTDEGVTGFVTGLARAFVHGASVDWRAVLPTAQCVELPTYAFRHERFWPEGEMRLPTGTVSGAGLAGGAVGAEAEALFWAAVEGGDMGRLAETLAVDGGLPFREVLPALASWRRREADRSVTAGWRYRASWVPVVEPDARVVSGTWLVAAPASAEPAAIELRRSCVAALEARGASTVVVEVPAGLVERAELAALIGADVSDVAGVLSLLALDEAPLPGGSVVAGGLAATLALVQGLGDAGVAAPLWVATRGAVAAGAGEVLTAPVQAQVWGLGRVVAMEHPDRWGGLIDLPEVVDERAGARLASVLAGCGEGEVAIRAAGVLGRRLAHAPQPRETETPWTPRGTTLITGGTGAIAGHVARWLAGRGASRLVLTSRSGPAAQGAAVLAAELAEAGSAVDVVACDVSDRVAVAGLLESTGPDLSAVMHTAGVLDDGVVDRLSAERLEPVLTAKATSAAYLDELTADLDLDAFVLFSSAAATLGAAGQGNYAAANAYLDALAESRRSRGLAGLSVAWGAWAGGGFAASSDVVRARVRRGAMPAMDPSLAVRALGEALEGSDPALTVMDVDWAQLASSSEAAHIRELPLVRDLPEIRSLVAAGSASGAVVDEGELVGRLRGLGRAEEQTRVLAEVVRTEAAAVLGHASAEAVQDRQNFKDLGFDSLTSVELRNRLASVTGLRLPATLVFDYPTPVALAGFLRGELTGDLESVAPVVVAAGVSDEPLAIVGMACRFPGGVASPEAFWELLASGGDAVGGFPTDRGWDLDSVYDPDRGSDGTSYTRSGAFLREAAQFDAGFFGISPREALAMDPQQRLLLEASWEALERAGIDAGSLRGSATGVFAGGFASGYGIGIALSGQSGSGVEGHLMTGNATSVLSGRVSYVMGLEGPAVTVDTACSSSLVALHLAAQALRSGECSLALAGGVTVMATPATFIDFSRQQGLSVDGRCRAFSADADGTGWAEGAGMLVVERLSDAQRNGHPILAIVRGSAVNQDGASNGLTAPNGPSQQRVIRAALASAQLSPADVDVVEAHGTGTKLGDPIEAQALLATYGQERTDGRALLLGSVKSNIGHTQAAAGVAGIIKIVLALQHGELPPTLHADEPSPHVDWSAGEVSLLTESVGWPAGERPRRAGVSSFGMSGTNAHVIIEEAPDAEPVESSGGVEPVVSGAGAWLVSGRTAAGLSAQAGRLREWVTERPGLEPADVAWSLAATRSVFEHRAVVLGADRAELVAGLESVAAGVSSGAVVSGVARSDARVGLVFAGQGSQWLGMGRGLYEGSAVFARVFDEVTGLLELELGVSVRDVVLGAEGVDEGLVNQTLYAQTGLFAFEVALAEVLRGVGVVADAVVGHSVGELVAAYVAGVLSLPDACRLVAARARLMQGLPSGGAMAAVNASEADVTASMAGVASVSIAAVNGPDSMVVSGDADAVAQVAEYWREQGRRVRELRVSHAFHSPAMDPVTGELGRVASELEYHRPDVLWAGALSGELVSECEPGYWPAQARQAVRFADALGTLAAQGINLFIEVGPDGSLSALGRDAVAQVGVEEAVFVPLQRRTDEGVTGFVTGLARAFVHGASVDWTAVLPTASRVELPTYAFRHERFWPEGELRLPLGGAADGEQRGGIEAEARFWAAVEEGDLSRLAESLAGGDDRPIGEVLPALASWRRREADRSVTAGWRYRASWVPVVEPDARVVSGTWLVAAPASAEPAAVELRRSCVAALEARGAEVVVVEVGTTERAELAALIGAEVSDVAGVLSLLALDEAPLPGGSVVAGGLAATLALVQGLGDAGVAAPLWVATRGAVAAGAGEVLTAPVQAQVWGLGRVVGLEHPDRWGGLIDLPEVVDERAGARLASVLAGCGEGEVAIRAAGVLGRRLAHAPQPRETETPWTPRGTTLITGGTGAIAGHVARWLADRRAPRLVLSSRSGPSAFGAGALAAELAQAGSAVDIVACDVSDRVAVAGLLESTGPDLSAVMHTAGVLDDGVVDRLSAERLEPVLTAKATSAAYLDELTADLDLDAFVLFSSAAATLGAAGQGNYAAANAYLDALAESRRSRGLAGLSVAWGAWAGGGFAASSDVVRARVRRGAMPAMDPSLAVRALGEALEGSDPALTVMDVDWAQLASSSEAAHIRELPLVRDLPEIRQAARAASAVGAAEPTEGELVKRLAGLSREEQERALTEVVRIEAAAVLGHASTDAVSDRQNFKDLGFDSLTSVELRNRLASVTGRRLPSTLVFDYPNPAALAAYLRGELTGDLGSAAPVVVAAGVSDEPLAIVGMACRFPGGVASPEAFWELLASGGDAVGGFPTDRGWDLDSVYDPDGGSDGTSYTRSGAFLREAAQFDAGFFGVSPREALAMDPQQRLLLEASWEAFERAGIDPGSLRGSATGVFAGGFSSSYNIGVALSEQGTAGVEGHLMTGNATSVLSGRVSYVMGLEGPAVTIDTACSSSLVALHLAGQALRSGECSLALAGGVTVMATPATFIDFSRQQGLSVDGRCRAFSADADGTGWAEGAGMLVVERLSDARRNGHPVLAVLRGSAVNQDGASNGLTAPNGPSQQRVIRAALASAQLSPADVDVVEAHGTGTKLGDPIEAQALLATYGQDRPEGLPVWLGSVKSNIGHTQAAAGVAGLIKMVLALQHEQLPPTLHAEVASPHVDWSAGEVSLLTESVGWPAGERPRRAGVSSFGMSGTNAHVIIEEAPDAEPVESSGGVEPVVSGAGAWLVSGRTAAGLSAQAGRLREWVTERPGLEPADVAWSLAATRSVFEHRAVVLGGGRAELVAGLESVAAGVSSGAVVSGVARSDARVGLVFAGQGSQWLGMGRGLYEGSAVFARVFDQVSGLLELELGVSVRDVVLGAQDADESLVNQTLYAQTGLFAFEVALAELLAASGLAADAVVGHSVGEVVAAYVAGVLSLPDACRLVAARARLMQGLPSGGAMAAVNASEADVTASMAGVAGVSIAAVNGPDSVVVSGDADAVAQVVEYWREQGRRVRELRVSHAFHSPAMDPVTGELGRVASELEYHRPQVLWAGALSGELVSECEPGYWPAQTRQAVRFADALGTLAAQGINLFIEVGPDGSLSALGADAGEEAVFVPLQRRTDEGVTGFVTGLARAFVHGASVDWAAVLPTASRVELPTYAFRHERFWPEGEMRLPTGTVSGAGLAGGAEVDARFWAAVEGGDLGRLAETLAVDGGLPFREVLPALASWRRREADRSVTAGWRYRAVWAPVAEPDARVLSGTWLVVVPAEPAAVGLRRSCVAALEARGAETVVVEVGTTERAELAALISAEVSDVAGVLSLLALDETPLSGHPSVTGGLAGTLALVQALGDVGVVAPLWVATRGAVAAGAGEVLTAPVQAQVWGLGRVVGLEHPDRWGGLVDLPEVVDERAGARLASVLAGCGEGEVAIRAAGVLGRRLAHAPRPRETETPWTPRGTTLITGGTGAIAGHVARWLADRRAPRLVLTSRSGPSAFGAGALAAELAEAGSAVDIVACDVSDRVALAGLLESTGPELSAVMHTAGVLDDGVVDRLSVERLESVLTAKATSATYLDELTADLDLDAFVLFSSAAATLGAAGQGNYAAANAYLDALAENRRSRGLAGLSVAWGAWAGGGFAASSDVVRARVRRGAMPAMDPSLTVRALGEALEGSDPALTVMDVDWAQLASGSGAAGIHALPLVRDLPEIRSLVAAGSASGAVVDEGELVGRLRGLGRAEEQTRVLAEVVRTEAAAVLGHASAEAVQDRQNFKDLGFDSLTSVELRNRLSTATGLRLPSTLVFDYPTPVALAAWLRAELLQDYVAEVPVLAELDRLEAALLGGPKDESVWEQAADRLRKLLDTVDSAVPSRQRREAELESATDDELFTLVDELD
ncbi:type I polyketide synthase [Streptomyces turgidiscabies]|nr:SDR family NAD(P)-dependent oxidoreductase [Streptomyces turgidiscabies]